MASKYSSCPHCKEQFDIDDESLVGQNLMCPFCNEEFTLQPESVFEVDGAQEYSADSLSQDNKQVFAPNKVINKSPRLSIKIKNAPMPVPHEHPVPVESKVEPANFKADEKVCPFCGESIKKVALKCRFCQSELSGISKVETITPSEKTILPALLLFFLLGILSAHRFYAGRKWTGVVQLIFGVIFLLFVSDGYAPHDLDPFFKAVFIFVPIFLLIDLIMIITGTFKDGEGRKITKWT